MAAALYLSFCHYDVLHTPTWLGMKNYARLWADLRSHGVFYISLRNTAQYALGTIPLGLALALGLALLLNAGLKGISFHRTRLLPAGRHQHGRGRHGVDVDLRSQLRAAQLSSRQALRRALHSADLAWQSQPGDGRHRRDVHLEGPGVQRRCIYLAGLQGIPEQLYEAALIDGAGPWQRFRAITWPLLKPTTAFLLIVSVIGASQVFAQVYVMTNGGPNNATTTIVHQIFENAFHFMKMGYASAMAFVLFGPHLRALAHHAAPHPRRPGGILMKLHLTTKALLHLLLALGGLTMLLPFLWMLSTSLKPEAQIFASPTWIPKVWQWGNYAAAMSAAPFARYFANTLLYAVLVTGSNLLLCSLAAYAFARLRFRGKNVLFVLVLATMMIPAQVTMVPVFIMLKHWPLAGGNDLLGAGGHGLLNSYTGLVLPGAVGAFGIFLLRQFFLTLPRELEDAARLDGCSEFGLYWRIILPLSTPALATLGIFTFTAAWNEFLWPLLITSKDSMKTLQLGLQIFQTQYKPAGTSSWPAPSSSPSPSSSSSSSASGTSHGGLR